MISKVWGLPQLTRFDYNCSSSLASILMTPQLAASLDSGEPESKPRWTTGLRSLDLAPPFSLGPLPSCILSFPEDVRQTPWWRLWSQLEAEPITSELKD